MLKINPAGPIGFWRSTRDPGGFITACNTLLHELDAPQDLVFGDRVDAAIERPVEADIAFLTASVPHLSLGPDLTARELRGLLEARHDPDLNLPAEMLGTAD